jgi:hypothetical protein
VFIENPCYDPENHYAPCGLAVDPDNGDVCVADTDRRQVDRYSETGIYIRSFGQNGVSGTGAGLFEYPSRVAVRDGRVYIVDTWSHRIVAYDRVGTVELWSSGSWGGGPGQFKSLEGSASTFRDACSWPTRATVVSRSSRWIQAG